MNFWKKRKQKTNQKSNTIEIKYMSLMEQNLKEKLKIIELQDKVIRLQEQSDIYKQELINNSKIDVVKLRTKKEKK